MNCKDKFKYYNDISIEVIQIPFFNNDLSALILLPNQNYSIDKIISKLNQNILNKYKLLLNKINNKKYLKLFKNLYMNLMLYLILKQRIGIKNK